jgi:hypothetical protein
MVVVVGGEAKKWNNSALGEGYCLVIENLVLPLNSLH